MPDRMCGFLQEGTLSAQAARWISLALACALSLSLIASLAALSLKYMLAGLLPTGPMAVTLFGLMGLAALWGWSPSLLRRPQRLAAALAVGFFVLRAGLVFWVSDYPQEADCVFFQDTVERLAQDGWNRTTFETLSRIYYDDYLWIGRSLPLHLPLRHLFGEYHVLAAQLANVLLSSLTILVLARIGKRMLPDSGLSIALLVFALLPVHTWLVLDYTHQVLGSFLVACAVWLALRICDRIRAKTIPWGISVCLGALLLLLHIQGGIDYFMVLALGGLAALCLFDGRPAAPGWRFPLFLLLLPLLVYLPPSRAYSEWSASYKPIRMSSHPISFTARGWSLQTGGEYDGKYEQLDREAPYPRKAETMRRLIASQFHYNPWRTSFELPIIKVAKYFLIGFATGIDHRLTASGHSTLAAFFLTTRLLMTPIFLALCVAGCLQLWHRRPIHAETVWLVALPSLFLAVYLVAGETSPRYSFHMHSILALLVGQLPVQQIPRGGQKTGPILRRLFLDLARLAICAMLIGLGLVFAASRLPSTALFLDIRKVVMGTDPASAGRLTAPGHLAPFESWVDLAGLEDRTFEARLHVSDASDMKALSFYMWPPQSPTDARLRFSVEIDGVQADAWANHETGHVVRREVELPQGANEWSFTLRGNFESISAPVHGSVQPRMLRWGYVALHRNAPESAQQ